MHPKKPAAARKTKGVQLTQPQVDGSLAIITGFLADESQGEFHRLINERVRLGIMSALAVTPSMSFSELKTLLDVTDGNLSMHARKLEDAGYLKCKKGFDGRVPKTEFSVSIKGRDALARYLKHMEALIKATEINY
ncbi:MAG: transcriptional regulator [Proteobacteria bacterium]|nr:transcriptional regulator [Pseudomonadota bacterium]